MRKRLAAMALTLGVLAGCGAQEIVPTASLEQTPYSIIFAVPTDASLETFSELSNTYHYVQPDGDYEIVSQVCTGKNGAQLITALSGRTMENQTVIKTQRFGMPEYQFAWCAADGRLNRAAILEDQDYAYLLTFAVAPEKAPIYRESMNTVFSSFGLFSDEWA
ncbi:MAG: hypothetical protein PHS97_05850 [Oscillospiraceae bacterium]|nr:hypothetical protein [Oscillospiraceae bacterium]